MIDEAEITKQVGAKLEQTAILRARDRTRAARWDLDAAVFLFTVLIIIIILLFQRIGIEIVAPVAIFGLAMAWLLGWRRGKQLYQRFYDEELSKLRLELAKEAEGTAVETIEERVQRTLRERWR